MLRPTRSASLPPSYPGVGAAMTTTSSPSKAGSGYGAASNRNNTRYGPYVRNSYPGSGGCGGGSPSSTSSAYAATAGSPSSYSTAPSSPYYGAAATTATGCCYSSPQSSISSSCSSDSTASLSPPPSSRDSNEFKDKQRNKNRRRPTPTADDVRDLVAFLKEPSGWITVAAVIFAWATFAYRSSHSSFLHELKVANLPEAVEEYHVLHDRMRRLQAELSASRTKERETDRRSSAEKSALQRENRQLLQERDELRAKYEGPERYEELWHAEAREEAWKLQVDLLRQATTRESRRAVKDKFGPGPHYVEMSVLFPDDETETPQTFVVELAPLDLMPHTVHMFLEQVDHGLWNNAWFYINGPHVLQGGPQADEEDDYDDEYDDDRALAVKRFRELELETLAFPEYSDQYPHVPWTLGYTGRPGGPDWYINKADNTESHGPGGQYQHDLEEFADPCFAKVVAGYKTLHAVFRSPTVVDDEEYEYFLEDPVHIVKAVVLEGFGRSRAAASYANRTAAAKAAAKAALAKHLAEREEDYSDSESSDEEDSDHEDEDDHDGEHEHDDEDHHDHEEEDHEDNHHNDNSGSGVVDADNHDHEYDHDDDDHHGNTKNGSKSSNSSSHHDDPTTDHRHPKKKLKKPKYDHLVEP